MKRTKGKNALGQDQEIEWRWMRIERQTDRQTDTLTGGEIVGLTYYYNRKDRQNQSARDRAREKLTP